ncbi:MAG: glycosyltransferase 87 family protein [Micromonosporaceae bacterium]
MDDGGDEVGDSTKVTPSVRSGRFTTLDRRTWIRLGLVVLACLGALGANAAFGRGYRFFDMLIYHDAVAWWLGGGDLYAFTEPRYGLGFTYPPFSAILLLPITLMSGTAAGWINFAAGLVVATVVAWWLLGPVAARYGWPRWYAVALAVPIVAATDPVRETLGYGQVNLILLGLIFADLVALRNGYRWAGVGVGLAAAIKLTPALFIVYFAVSRQGRAALTAAGTAAAATLLGFLVTPSVSWEYWTGVLWDTQRVGQTDLTPNQSLAGWLARLYDQGTTPRLLWLAFGLLLLAVGISRAIAAHREQDELTAFTLVGLTTVALSPVSWTHHIVWIAPALLVLGDTALHHRSWRYGLATIASYAIFVTSPMWWYEHKFESHWADGFHGMLIENAFIVVVVVLIAALPWRPGVDPVYQRFPGRRLDPVPHAW